MGMQINVDPADMTQEQREAVAGFILAYPVKSVAAIPAFIHKDTADAGLIQTCRELEILHHEHESTLPNAAFGRLVVNEATAAFGSAAAVFCAGFELPKDSPAIAENLSHDPAAAFGSAAAPVPFTTPASTPAGSAPPAPVNTAPITTTLGLVSSAAPASPGVLLDSQGLPWDGRIHVESKNKNADGTWRKKRSLDAALLAQVEAELRQVMGASGAPLAPVAGAAPAMPAAPSVAPAPPPAPVAAPSVAPAPPPGEVPADARAQFVALIGRASAAIQQQKVTQAEVNQCCTDAGVPALPLLANRLDLVPVVAYNIDALIANRQ
jgi:hypothetical protein